LRSNATSFLTADGIGTLDHTDLMLNTIAISVIAVASVLVGAVLGYISRLVHSSLTSRRLFRLSWVAATVSCLLILVVWASSLPRVTDANGKSVQPGMHRREVEAILGRPNPVPGDDFWDAYTHLGRRYVSVAVWYDRDGRVERVETDGFWRTRRWLYW
jgi:hypothetical protein